MSEWRIADEAGGYPRARYTLGWATGGQHPASFTGQIIALIGAHQPEFAWARCGPVMYLARSLVAEKYLAQPAERATPTLIMVDPDIIFGPREIEALLEHPEPIVSGIYVDSEGDLVTEGCGFLRIDRVVFETLGAHCFDPVLAPGGVVSGEDVAFRKRAAEAGFDIAVDRSIRVGHVKDVMLWPDGTEHDQSNAAVRIVGRPVPMAPEMNGRGK